MKRLVEKQYLSGVVLKNSYLLMLFLVSNVLFAQLSVRNNNYIFIDNQVLFVEDDLNLNEATSKIYLRNEAQLIQGTGLTGNSGIGELSVYQEGNTGAYEFNYWCSPISEKISNNINNIFGISLLNDVTGLITSTPVSYNHAADYNGTASPLNIEPYWIWKFIASNSFSEWIHIQGNTNIDTGEGFTMKGTLGTSANNPGNNQRYDFRGKPNTGTISNSVTAADWTLVGNPYPSALDARDYIWDAQNINAITGTLYYWEQDPTVNSHYIADYLGGYATYTISSDGTVESFIPATFNSYNSDGSLNTVGASSSTGKRVYRYIPIGQGFMVEGKIGTSGTVRTQNSHREFYKESGTDSNFFRINNSKNKKEIAYENGLALVPEEYNRFRINVDFDDIYTRQLLQTFHENATDGFDYGLESKSPEGVSDDAYWILDNDPYVAQAFAFDINLKIPLVVNLSEEKSLRFRIFDIQNFNEDQPIYIHDKENNIFVDLRIQNYNINLSQGEYLDRFEITFLEDSILSNQEENFSSIIVFQDNNKSQLTILNPNLSQIRDVKLIDITGKIILSRQNLPQIKEHHFSTQNISSGTYIAYVMLTNGKVLTKKIVTTNLQF